MKVQCSYSGITFSISEVFKSLEIEQGNTIHPIFSLSKKPIDSSDPIAFRTHPLSILYTAYLNQELSSSESYLLFIAILENTGLVLFRSSILVPESKRNQLIANNIEALFSISTKLNACQHPYFIAPKVIISEENQDLDNIREIIQLWNVAYNDFLGGLAESQFYDSLKKKEQALAKFIKSPQIPAEKYAHVLADWAAMAANFPPEYCEYWKELIIKCYKFEEIIQTQQIHLEDLIEYCEENIDEYSTGSIQSNALFTCLSEGLGKITDFFGLNHIGSVGFSRLDESIPEQATMLKVIESAPSLEPIASNYSSKFEFLKAKMAYSASIKYAEKAKLADLPSSLNQLNIKSEEL